jgi:hypothetical protein
METRDQWMMRMAEEEAEAEDDEWLRRQYEEGEDA